MNHLVRSVKHCTDAAVIIVGIVQTRCTALKTENHRYGVHREPQRPVCLRSLTHSLTHSLTQSFIRSFVRSFVRSFRCFTPPPPAPTNQSPSQPHIHPQPPHIHSTFTPTLTLTLTLHPRITLYPQARLPRIAYGCTVTFTCIPGCRYYSNSTQLKSGDSLLTHSLTALSAWGPASEWSE